MGNFTFKELSEATCPAGCRVWYTTSRALAATYVCAAPVTVAQAKLRIGLAEQSVLVAIAHAVLLHKEGATDK
jgi:hypothetical protein